MNEFQHSFRGQRPGVGVGRGGYDKSGILKEYAGKWQVRTVIETGLFQGYGSGMDVPGVDYVAFDYQQGNITLAHERCPDGLFICGDSATRLDTYLNGQWPEHGPKLPVLFWLDAHTITAEEISPNPCPLLGELQAILNWRHVDRTVVLIDDLWGMGFIEGWPSLPQLRELAGQGPWVRDETEDIMRLTPRGSDVPC